MTLVDLAGKEVVDVTGHLIKCCGDCDASEKHKGFHTTVWCIHKAHNQNGHYIEACQDCRNMLFDEWYKGSSTHKVILLYLDLVTILHEANSRAEKLRGLINIVVQAQVMKNEENRMYSNDAITATTMHQEDSMENGSSNNVTTIGITDATTMILTTPKKNRKSGSIEFDEIFQVAKKRFSLEA